MAEIDAEKTETGGIADKIQKEKQKL